MQHHHYSDETIVCPKCHATSPTFNGVDCEKCGHHRKGLSEKCDEAIRNLDTLKTRGSEQLAQAGK